MSKNLKMTKFTQLVNPLTDEIYNEDGYKNCVQVEFNKDGTIDVYDYNTSKHLMKI
jgi:hypothetical protein